MTSQIIYGIGNFDRSLFVNIKNGWRNKPIGGLWSSTLIGDNKSDWYNWCIENNYRKRDLLEYKTFNFVDFARIYEIKNSGDLYSIVTNFLNVVDNDFIKVDGRKFVSIDYEKCSNFYDVIHLNKDAVENCSRTVYIDNMFYTNLSGWDCESSLILNYNCISGAIF